MNTKTKRLLDTLAILLKDERPALIDAIHEAIYDNSYGYPYNFKHTVANVRTQCQGTCMKESK